MAFLKILKAFQKDTEASDGTVKPSRRNSENI